MEHRPLFSSSGLDLGEAPESTVGSASIPALTIDLGLINIGITLGGPGDSTPPAVTAFNVNSISSHTTLTFQFSEDVTVLPGSLRLFNNSVGDFVSQILIQQSYDFPTRTLTYSFAGYSSGVLPAGLYAVTLPANSVYDLSLNSMAADSATTFVDVPASQMLSMPDGQTTLVDALYVDPAGKLDLSSGALIVDYSTTGPRATTSPLASIRTLLTTGYHNGLWNGLGISSSAVDPASVNSVGYAEASSLGFSSFAGVPLDSTAVVISFVTLGDANLSSSVNAEDMAIADRGAALQLFGWSSGDFNYDGVVNQTDYSLLYRGLLAPKPAESSILPGTADVAAVVSATDSTLDAADSTVVSPDPADPSTFSIPISSHRHWHSLFTDFASHHLGAGPRPLGLDGVFSCQLIAPSRDSSSPC